MKERFYSLREFRQILGVTAQTIRNWDYSGKLKPHHLGSNGYRYYSEDQLQKYISNNKVEKITIGYCRVSSKKQKDDLERQIEAVKLYISKKNEKFEIIQDIGSGINYNKSGLKKLLQLINDEKISRIVVCDKDRLLRFGFELIKNIADMHHVEIEIIDDKEKTDEQELVEDMIQIITVFSFRLHGKRANQTKKLLSEMKKNEKSIQSEVTS